MLSGRNNFRVTPAAGVGIAVDDASHFVRLGAMSPTRAERAGPEAQAGMTVEHVVAHGDWQQPHVTWLRRLTTPFLRHLTARCFDPIVRVAGSTPEEFVIDSGKQDRLP
jgi:hypothetical protein